VAVFICVVYRDKKLALVWRGVMRECIDTHWVKTALRSHSGASNLVKNHQIIENIFKKH
jgi:hypothetical protein